MEKFICAQCEKKAEYDDGGGRGFPLYLVNGKEAHLCHKCAEVGNYFHVFKVPSFNLKELEQRFSKLGRRAKKCGLPLPAFHVYREEPVRIEKKDDITGQVKVKAYILHYLTVDPGCATVKVEGWEFIATIQHTEEGNILRKVGDKEIPTKYRNVTQLCEHCNTNRNRKDTYILFHAERGEYKQVGRNCLADFFGHDALMYAERAQYLIDIADMVGSSEDDGGFGGGGGRGELFDPLEVYLGYVAECVQRHGWMSKSRAKAMNCINQATANIAYTYIHPPKDREAYNEWLRERPFDPPISEESQKLANDAIEWAANLEGEDISDYLHNIRVTARRCLVGGRDYGIAASIVAAYQRNLNALRMKEMAAKRAEISNFVGNIGDRDVFKLFVEKVINFERDGYSYYNPTVTVHMHIMSDKEGNQFTWWGSYALETGKEVTLKGTIKKHETYVPRNAAEGTPGIKQTVLSRCEEVELKNFLVWVDGKRYDFEALSEKDVRPMLRDRLGIKKLPRGLQIMEDKPEVVVLPLDNPNNLEVSL